MIEKCITKNINITNKMKTLKEDFGLIKRRDINNSNKFIKKVHLYLFFVRYPSVTLTCRNSSTYGKDMSISVYYKYNLSFRIKNSLPFIIIKRNSRGKKTFYFYKIIKKTS